MNPAPGRLFLVPAPLSDGALDAIPPSVVAALGGVADYVVENERTARRFLSKILPNEAIDAASFAILDEHTKPEDVPALLGPALAGRDLGLVSEAGCPCVADPGSRLVAAAHAAGVRVVPLPGPSSLVLALMASGFNGQAFAFNGYLPRDASERDARLTALERESGDTGRTELFIETPYRNGQLVTALLRVLKPDTRLSIAADLTGKAESVASKTIAEWRRSPPQAPETPAVFSILAAPVSPNRRRKP